MMVSIRVTFRQCNTFYWEITPTVSGIVNGFNYRHKFCVAFCSRMRHHTSNTRNSHSWGQQNAHRVTQCHIQQRYSVNVWCVASGNKLTGPRVIEGRMAAPYYRNFMENEGPRYSEYASLVIRGRQCIQYGGAPPHVGRKVTEFLNEHFERRWIGNKWAGGLARSVTRIEPIRFLPVGLHEVEIMRVSQRQTRRKVSISIGRK